MAATLLPMLRAHQVESMPDTPFDPDWDRMFQLDDQRILRLWTARSGTALVGYIGWIVAPMLMSQALMQASADYYWMAPAWRGGWTFYKMLKAGLVEFKECEVELHSRDPRIATTFRRLGFEPVRVCYRRR